MARVYLSLGSNIDPEENLRAALCELRSQFGELTISPVYRSHAVGFEGPDFLNLAVGMTTDVPVLALNDWLHELEDRQGRDRSAARFSNRTLDIDIVLYDDVILNGPGNLQLPRPEFKHAFVLKPMVDIAADAVHPVLRKTLAQLWAEFPPQQDNLKAAPVVLP